MTVNRQKRKPLPRATEGGWWRFSMYEIRGSYICPKEGSKLEWYDAWPEFEGTRAETIGQAPFATQPDYQSLLELAEGLQYGPGLRRYPHCVTQQSQQSILDWCRRHGLLGILLSRWETLYLAPQLVSDRWVQQSYFRGFGQAIEIRENTGDVEDRKARVLLRGLDDPALIEESPSKTWSKFFPSVAISASETFPYPAPYTDEFAHLYCERLSDFCNAAQLLAGAVLHLGHKHPKTEGDPTLAQQQAVEVINLLRRPIFSVLDRTENGTLMTRRVAPSLLASFADMFAQDLAYGRYTLQCVCCGTPFVSSAYQARYCSELCRLRDQKRRVRAQMKLAKSLRAEGKTVREIAAAVKQPTAIVKRWLTPKKQNVSR